jgi:hypothetical protein
VVHNADTVRNILEEEIGVEGQQPLPLGEPLIKAACGR